jgi:hypothetical protein
LKKDFHRGLEMNLRFKGGRGTYAEAEENRHDEEKGLENDMANLSISNPMNKC